MFHAMNNTILFLWDKMFILMQTFSLFLACNMAAVQNLYCPYFCFVVVDVVVFVVIDNINATFALRPNSGNDFAEYLHVIALKHLQRVATRKY